MNPPPIVGKTPWMTLHVAAPLQGETPLALLRQARITPKELFYVRNNQDLEGNFTTEAASGVWELELTGLLDTPQRLSVAELLERPQRELEMVLQCSGNSRGQFGKASPVSGAQWQDGAVANIVFGGVALKDVLEPLGVQKKAGYLTARGAGTPHEPGLPPFERSVPLADVWEDALLALTLNGEALPAVHGGPLRLVLPGYYGVNNVKWLTQLSLENAPSESLYQRERYRLPLTPLEPGSPFEPTPENSRPSWRMSVKSLLWQPLVGESQIAGRVQLGGVAWTDGRSAVSRVEVSLDRGENWLEAALERPQSPYAWCPWSLSVTLPAGELELWVRACDGAGNAQPLDGSAGWSPQGYEYSGAAKVRLTVR